MEENELAARCEAAGAPDLYEPPEGQELELGRLWAAAAAMPASTAIDQDSAIEVLTALTVTARLAPFAASATQFNASTDPAVSSGAQRLAEFIVSERTDCIDDGLWPAALAALAQAETVQQLVAATAHRERFPNGDLGWPVCWPAEVRYVLEYTPNVFKEAGYTLSDMFEDAGCSGFKLSELREAGFACKDLKDDAVTRTTIAEAIAAGLSMSELTAGGYDVSFTAVRAALEEAQALDFPVLAPDPQFRWDLGGGSSAAENAAHEKIRALELAMKDARAVGLPEDQFAAAEGALRDARLAMRDYEDRCYEMWDNATPEMRRAWTTCPWRKKWV